MQPTLTFYPTYEIKIDSFELHTATKAMFPWENMHMKLT